MAYNSEKLSEIIENPLIIYLNRLQRQMIIITDLLYNSETDVNALKRRLLGLIDNLPPAAIKKFVAVSNKLKTSGYIPINELAKDYQDIHGWVYSQLLSENGYGLTQTASLPETKKAPSQKPLNPKQTSRI